MSQKLAPSKWSSRASCSTVDLMKLVDIEGMLDSGYESAEPPRIIFSSLFAQVMLGHVAEESLAVI